MTTRTSPRMLALAAALALLAPPVPALQSTGDSPEAAETAPQAKAPQRSPAERVEGLRADLERWSALASSQRGEDQEVALDQVRRTRDDLDAELDALAEAEEAASRELATEVSREEVAAVWSEFERLDQELKGLRADPPEDPEAGVTEEAIDRLESDEAVLLHRLAGHTARLVALGHPEADELRARLVAELEARAEMAVARLELRAAKLEGLEARLKDASEERKASLQERAAELKTLRDSARDAFARVNADLASLGVEVDPELKNARLEATGELVVEDFDMEVIAQAARRWGRDLRESAVEGLPQWLFRTLLFVGILLLFVGLSRLVRRLVRGAVNSNRLKFSSLLREFVVGLAGKLVVFFGLLIALSQIGIELGPVLAGLGIAGFVLGFALQDTLSNFASGLMILAYRPFDIGDAVAVAGITGKVSQMSLVSTTILTFDNQLLVVPNNRIWGDVITNITALETRRVDMTFGIGYEDDIPRAEEILTEVVTSHPKVLADPAPTIKLAELGDSSVDFVVRPWTRTEDYWDVKFDLTRAVKLRFDQEGISIPFPQRDVHLHHAGERETTLIPAKAPPADAKHVEDAAPALAAEDDDEGR